MDRALGTADLHIHTHYSDGRPSVRAVLDHVARQSRLRVIAITDHDTVEGAHEARALSAGYPFDVIVGEEVSSREGHILGLFIEQRIPPRLSAAETIAAIHEQGGLAIAAHPFIVTLPSRDSQAQPQGIGKALAALPFDAVEVDNSAPLMNWANFRAKRFNRRVARLPEVANSDAHIVEVIGRSFTGFPGTSMVDLRRAIETGRSTAHSTHYRSRELLAYGQFWLETLRPTGSVKVGSE